MTEAGPEWLEIEEGDIPFIASFPHTGTTIPVECRDPFVSPALALRDTDWHLEKVFQPVLPRGTTVIRTGISRSVIDVNRPPEGGSLYPGQATTGLCPETDFDGTPLYRPGCLPNTAEVERRRAAYHAPYASSLQTQIARLRNAKGRVVVLDCHSIRPRVSRLFPGTLPVLNIGTNDGMSCSADLQSRLEKAAARSPFSWVANGRFRGGWITRHFADPQNGIQSVQIEIAMNAYLNVDGDEQYGAPDYVPENARLLQHTLRALIAELVSTG